MDSSAKGHDYVAVVEAHGSQVAAAKGFGGKHGVGTQQDASALGWDTSQKVDLHTSSTGKIQVCVSLNSPVVMRFV